MLHEYSRIKVVGTNLYMALAVAVLLLAGSYAAQAQIVTTILDFPNTNALPQGVIAQGRDGDYYGLTESGDAVYKVTASGTYTLLTTIPQSQGQGCNGLVLGTDGNFYGTCFGGGDNGNSTGTFIKVTPTGTVTVLHYFDGSTVSVKPDGCYPVGLPFQASDGNFYGTAESCGEDSHGLIAAGMAYKLTPAGVFTALHGFDGGATDGAQPRGTLIQGSDGNLWGTTYGGGPTGSGTIFKMTLTGVVTVVYQFNADGTGANGSDPYGGLVQGTDGNYYGMAQLGGANGQGVVFKVTPGGVYTLLHSFNRTTDNGAYPQLPLTLGTDGNFYGIATDCYAGGCSPADIFKITSKGVFTDVYNFPNAGGNNNSLPFTPLLLATNGTFYSTTEQDGSGTGSNSGTFFSLADGQKAFALLQETSGKVGSKIGILGQGFSASSVVKFNGTQATTVTRTGSTFLLATVPAGATNGFVTVTTGATTLTSSKKFVVHNSWSSGKAIPTGTVFSSAAVLGGGIYVIGGDNASGTILTDVQIYNPTTNTWSTGTPLPAATDGTSAAVVNNILYVFGGSTTSGVTGAVWAYSPKTKAWTSMAPMPTPRNGTLAVVEKNIVYVMGGSLGGGANFVATVESYNPATNTWTAETSMDGAKDFPGGGLIGTTIVAADGSPAGSVVTGDTEGYNVTTNSWSELTADPTARTGPCSGVIGSTFYDASGYINNAGAATTVNESFSLTTNKWTTTLLPIPQGTMFAASAVDNGQLYCLGGWAVVNSTAINNVQIYQP